MDNRFRREENLSHTTQKKVNTKRKDISEIHSHDKNDDTTFSASFFEIYKRASRKHLVRDTVLLVIVLGSVLLTLSFILPRIFSFNIHPNYIFNIFSDWWSSASKSNKEDVWDVDVLILGRGWRGNSAPDLTDSIILGHYNKEKNSFSSLSIPRDLLVQSDKLGRVKINELYSSTKKTLWEDAAMNHLMEMVSQITGRDVRMYVLIDFTWFQKLIDAVGGIDIDVPERLYDSEYPTANWGYTIVNIPAGLQHFDWDKALKYARSRHTTSDFDRSRRQQLVIHALREKMLSLNILSSPDKIEWVYSVLSDSVQTNMGLKDMFKMAKIASNVDRNNLHGYALDSSCFNTLKLCEPGGLIYSPGRDLFHWMSVLLPKKVSTTSADTYENIRLLVSIITQYPWLQSEPGIAVVNGSGKTNLALTIALKLKAIGIPVDETQIKNQTEKVEKTFIRYNTSILPANSTFLSAMSLAFHGEKREASESERLWMLAPYELVLGRDASLYFQ
jgi:LCP family protein required for cell wall assembly